MKYVNNLVPQFNIANLNFVYSNKTEILDINQINEIYNRFEYISKYLSNPKNTDYIKNNKQIIPYHSLVAISDPSNNLILTFRRSFNKPLMLIINTKENIANNYIDLNDAKVILSDKIYNYLIDELSFPKNLNFMFKNIPDINSFMDYYEEKLQENPKDLFEIEL